MTDIDMSDTAQCEGRIDARRAAKNPQTSARPRLTAAGTPRRIDATAH